MPKNLAGFFTKTWAWSEAKVGLEVGLVLDLVPIGSIEKEE